MFYVFQISCHNPNWLKHFTKSTCMIWFIQPTFKFTSKDFPKVETLKAWRKKPEVFKGILRLSANLWHEREVKKCCHFFVCHLRLQKKFADRTVKKSTFDLAIFRQICNKKFRTNCFESCENGHNKNGF